MSALRSLILAFFLLLPLNAIACEPCLTKAPISKTINTSSVIVIVTNKDRDSSAYLESGPEVVTLQVEKTLKGDPGGETVDVHSWYGKCPYGVHMALGQRAIVFLQESNDIMTGQWDGTYHLVDTGCSVGQLEIRSGKVYVDKKSLTVDDFIDDYIGR